MRFLLSLLLASFVVLATHAASTVSKFNAISVSSTNYSREVIVTNGLTLGGVRNTAWPSGDSLWTTNSDGSIRPLTATNALWSQSGPFYQGPNPTNVIPAELVSFFDGGVENELLDLPIRTVRTNLDANSECKAGLFYAISADTNIVWGVGVLGVAGMQSGNTFATVGVEGFGFSFGDASSTGGEVGGVAGNWAAYTTNHVYAYSSLYGYGARDLTAGATSDFATTAFLEPPDNTVDISGMGGIQTTLYLSPVQHATTYAIYSGGGKSYHAGDLGLGQQPGTEKLEVTGNIKATGNFVSGTTAGISTTYTNLISGVITQRLTFIGGILVTNKTL